MKLIMEKWKIIKGKDSKSGLVTGDAKLEFCYVVTVFDTNLYRCLVYCLLGSVARMICIAVDLRSARANFLQVQHCLARVLIHSEGKAGNMF